MKKQLSFNQIAISGIIVFMLIISGCISTSRTKDKAAIEKAKTTAFTGEDTEGEMINVPSLSLKISGQDGLPVTAVPAGTQFIVTIQIDAANPMGKKIPGVANLYGFEGILQFNADQLEVVNFNPGKFTPAGWKINLLKDPDQTGQAAISILPPEGENQGLEGSGNLIDIIFKAKEKGKGGVAPFSLAGGKFTPAGEGGEFVYTGYLRDTKGESIPVRSFLIPDLGISNYIQIIPAEVQITCINLINNIIRVDLDKSTSEVIMNNLSNTNLTFWFQAGTPDKIIPLKWPVQIEKNSLFFLFKHPEIKLNPGTQVHIQYEIAVSGKKRLEGTTPLFTIPQAGDKEYALFKAPGTFKFKDIKLTYNGEKRLSFSAQTPPRLFLECNLGGPIYYEVQVLDSYKNLKWNKTIRPIDNVKEGIQIPIDAAWQTGEYSIHCLAKYLFDYYGTTLTEQNILLVID